MIIYQIYQSHDDDHLVHDDDDYDEDYDNDANGDDDLPHNTSSLQQRFSPPVGKIKIHRHFCQKKHS